MASGSCTLESTVGPRNTSAHQLSDVMGFLIKLLKGGGHTCSKMPVSKRRLAGEAIADIPSTMAHIIGKSHCIRCYSKNVKFRYYNNKKINEPRYWCNNCSKYYTHGGKIRNAPIIVVGARNSPAPSAAMEVAEEEEEEEEEARVNEVENNNESEVNTKNAEEEVTVAQGRPGIQRARISADESRESQLVPTLGALRTQRRKSTPVKALLK